MSLIGKHIQDDKKCSGFCSPEQCNCPIHNRIGGTNAFPMLPRIIWPDKHCLLPCDPEVCDCSRHHLDLYHEQQAMLTYLGTGGSKHSADELTQQLATITNDGVVVDPGFDSDKIIAEIGKIIYDAGEQPYTDAVKVAAFDKIRALFCN